MFITAVCVIFLNKMLCRRELYRREFTPALVPSEIFIPPQKFIPVSCKRGMTVRFISIKDDFQSELRSLRTLMFIGRTRWNANRWNANRWNANRCYSLKTTYLIFETFQSPFPTDSLIFTAVKLFHEVI